MATLSNDSRSYLANLAISIYRGVTLSTNGGVTYSGNAAIPDGYAMTDAASGDYIAVRGQFTGGTLKGVITAAPVTVGDTLYAGALGRVSTTGTVVVGKSLTTSGGAANAANDTVIEFIPRV